MEQTMKQIASFTVNHDKLEKGMYISRIDGDVVTYDIRMKKTERRRLSFERRAAHLRAPVCDLRAQQPLFRQRPVRRPDGLPDGLIFCCAATFPTRTRWRS